MRNETGTAYCPNCEKRVTAHLEDFGIGAYEFWGYRGVDVQLAPTCDECGGSVDDYDPDEYERDWDAEMEERRMERRHHEY